MGSKESIAAVLPGSKPGSLKLLDRWRARIRRLGLALRTEHAYVAWVRRFILFNGKRHPAQMGEAGRSLSDPPCDTGKSGGVDAESSPRRTAVCTGKSSAGGSLFGPAPPFAPAFPDRVRDRRCLRSRAPLPQAGRRERRVEHENLQPHGKPWPIRRAEFAGSAGCDARRVRLFVRLADSYRRQSMGRAWGLRSVRSVPL
jgi:hypothetical protein